MCVFFFSLNFWSLMGRSVAERLVLPHGWQGHGTGLTWLLPVPHSPSHPHRPDLALDFEPHQLCVDVLESFECECEAVCLSFAAQEFSF